MLSASAIEKGYMAYYIFLCFVLPLAMLCFYLERRARRIIISMIGGAIAGLLAYWINTFIRYYFGLEKVTVTKFIAPVVEELLKFIPVIAVHFIVKKGRRGSAANAYSVGLGFCVSENFLYLFTSLDSAGAIWLISRCVCTGIMHSMTTTLMGIGIYSARTSEKYRVWRVVLSVLAAITFHMAFNIMVQITALHVVGLVLPILVFLVLFVVVKKESLHKFLWDETDVKKQSEEEAK